MSSAEFLSMEEPQEVKLVLPLIRKASLRKASMASDGSQSGQTQSPASSVGPSSVSRKSSTNSMISTDGRLEETPQLPTVYDIATITTSADTGAKDPSLMVQEVKAESEQDQKKTSPGSPGLFWCSAQNTVGLLSRGVRALGGVVTSIIPTPRNTRLPNTLSEMDAHWTKLALQITDKDTIDKARAFRTALLQRVLFRSMSPETVNYLKDLPIVQELKQVEHDAMRSYSHLKSATEFSDALERVLSDARRAGLRLVDLVTSHMTQAGVQFQAGNMADNLLPQRGCSLNLRVEFYAPRAVSVASGLAAIEVFALMELHRIFGLYADVAISIGSLISQQPDADQNPELKALAARARAVKRDVCLLLGTCTNLTLEPFQQLVVLLMMAAIAPVCKVD